MWVKSMISHELCFGVVYASEKVLVKGSRKYLHGKTPFVEVGSDVFLGQRLQQILGKTSEQAAGLDR